MPVGVVQEHLERLLKRRFGFGVHLIIMSYVEEPFEGFDHLINNASDWNGFTWVHVPSSHDVQLFSTWAMV
jgi:hypothetical protein